MAGPSFGTNLHRATTFLSNDNDPPSGNQRTRRAKKSVKDLSSKIRTSNYDTPLSPYAAELAIYIGQQQSIRHAKLSADANRSLHWKDTIFSDAEKRNLEKEWMTAKLSNDGWTTKTGVHMFNWVEFIDLDQHNDQHRDAYNEAQIGRLPTNFDFYGIFAVMCHLNDKAMDPDKLCMPRNHRIKAIQQELFNPGTTNPPEGYASVSKACWSFDVKNNWALLPAIPKCVAQKNKDGSLSVQFPLESAYYIIALNHIGKDKNGQIKHRSRDDTQKWVRGVEGIDTDGNDSFTTQIIKDFVAACPGCNESPMRASRQRGAETTRSHGGNKEKRKDSNFSPKKRRAEPDSEIHTPSPSKKRVVESPSQVRIFENQYPMDANPYNKTSDSSVENPSQVPILDNQYPVDTYPNNNTSDTVVENLSQVAMFNNHYAVDANPYNKTSDTVDDDLSQVAMFNNQDFDNQDFDNQDFENLDLDSQYPVDANPYNKTSNNGVENPSLTAFDDQYVNNQYVDNQYPVDANPYNMVQQQDQQNQNFQSPDSDQKSEQFEESSSMDSRLSNTDNSKQFDSSQQSGRDQNDQSPECFAEYSTSLSLEDLVWKDNRWLYKTSDGNVHEDQPSLVDYSTSISRDTSTNCGVVYQQ